jgi:hypothetical protein
MTECRFRFMSSKTMALKNARFGVGGQIFLLNQEGVQKMGPEFFCRCIGAKQIKQAERKWYWPNTRTINRLNSG